MTVCSRVLIVFAALLSLVACRSSTLTGEFAGRATDTEYYTRLKLRLENGTEVLIENVAKHTGESMEQAFDKLLSPTPIDLSQFTADEREAIALGQVRKGMSRDAVLVAMGYPPVTGTPTLDSHTWKYWRNRWATFLIVFDDQWQVVECPA